MASTCSSSLQATIGFDLFLSENLRTLSTNTANDGDFIQGLLYVPTLASNDPCTNSSATYFPPNVTRLTDLPAKDNTYYIALVPWTKECITPYLAAANADEVAALVTYIPDNSTGSPPLANSPQWSLGDGGQWKSQNKYPVYAIPGTWGSTIMQELGRYSGPLNKVPHGDLLANQYHSTDYVRLYTSVQTQAASQLPKLWTFLLIILGIILLLMFVTSCAMHYHQRRHRRELEQRVRNGEVNLESMGVKRMAVPKEVLDTIPLTTYTPGSSGGDGIPSDLPETSFDQPSCVICLDDFVAHETRVRNLPCQHIFHPECVDQLLLRHSSLCPICKASVLPNGYCPVKITNVMVRRERMARRFGDVERRAEGNAAVEQNRNRSRRPNVRANGRMASFHRQFSLWGRHRGSAQSPTTAAGLEMTEQTTCPQPPAPSRPALPSPDSANRISPTTSNMTRPPAASQSADRSERARRRIGTLLGRNAPWNHAISDGAVISEDALYATEDEDTRSKWRRAVTKAFPGFR